MGLVKIESTSRYIYLYKPGESWADWTSWRWEATLYAESGWRYQVLLTMLNNGRNRVLDFHRYITLDMHPAEEKLLFALADIPCRLKRVREILDQYIHKEINAEEALERLRTIRIAQVLKGSR